MVLGKPAREGESPVWERKEDKTGSRVPRDTRNLVGRSGDHPVRLEKIQDSFKRIKEWGQDLNLEDTILALNIIDQFVEQDNDNYSTRIEIRIADTK